MARRSEIFSFDTSDELNENDTVSEVPEFVVIRNLRPANVAVVGVVTGNRYEFPPGGEVKVHTLDAQDILSKKRGRMCCGGSFTPFFELGG